MRKGVGDRVGELEVTDALEGSFIDPLAYGGSRCSSKTGSVSRSRCHAEAVTLRVRAAARLIAIRPNRNR
jgi:hypothetical protein